MVKGVWKMAEEVAKSERANKDNADANASKGPKAPVREGGKGSERRAVRDSLRDEVKAS